MVNVDPLLGTVRWILRPKAFSSFLILPILIPLVHYHLYHGIIKVPCYNNRLKRMTNRFLLKSCFCAFPILVFNKQHFHPGYSLSVITDQLHMAVLFLIVRDGDVLTHHSVPWFLSIFTSQRKVDYTPSTFLLFPTSYVQKAPNAALRITAEADVCTFPATSGALNGSLTIILWWPLKKMFFIMNR